MRYERRFLAVGGILVENNRPVFEIVEDDGYYTSHGFYYDEDEAENKAYNLNRIHEEKEKDVNNGAEGKE